MSEPSQDAINVVKNAIDVAPNAARFAIMAYHSHLRARGLKVTSRNETPEMKAVDFDSVPDMAWQLMHDAAPEVFG